MESKSERMLIIDPEVINKGEKELISSILTSVDSYHINKLFNKNFGLTIREKLVLNEGDIVVYDSQVAYRLDFNAVATISLLLDKRGHFQGFTNPNDIFLLNAEETDSENIITDFELIRLKETEFLDALAATIDKKKIIEYLHNVTKLKSNGIVIYKEGDIVIFNGQVTYKLTFDFKTNFSLFLDRTGNYLGFSLPEDINRIPKNGNE